MVLFILGFILHVFLLLLLRDGLLPVAWKKTKITPIHKRAEHALPQNYRLIVINGCILSEFTQ